jgi:hypothetical protein
MPSPEASRRNARKSTGPRSPEGKEAARLNSLTHGAFAADLLLPGEDAKAFRALEKGFRRYYRPANQEEEFFLNRMVLAAWRLQRLAAMESRVLRNQASSVASSVSLFGAVRELIQESDDPPSPSSDPPSYHDPIASAWVHDTITGNTLVKLGRSQTAMERSFYRALHEFQRLRSPVPPSS